MSVPSLFIIKQNDRLPRIRAQLLDSTGKPLSLTGKTVTFRMRPAGGGAIKVNLLACDIVDGPRGITEYAWAGGNTDTLGDFNAEFVVTDASLVQTVPSNGFITVRVIASLA